MGRSLSSVGRSVAAPARCSSIAVSSAERKLGPDGTEVEVVRTEGGHHFDGDYEALAAKILAGAKQRMQRGAAGSGR
jgi:type IV secretory pathway VirJ component